MCITFNYSVNLHYYPVPCAHWSVMYGFFYHIEIGRSSKDDYVANSEKKIFDLTQWGSNGSPDLCAHWSMKSAIKCQWIIFMHLSLWHKAKYHCWIDFLHTKSMQNFLKKNWIMAVYEKFYVITQPWCNGCDFKLLSVPPKHVHKEMSLKYALKRC